MREPEDNLNENEEQIEHSFTTDDQDTSALHGHYNALDVYLPLLEDYHIGDISSIANYYEDEGEENESYPYWYQVLQALEDDELMPPLELGENFSLISGNMSDFPLLPAPSFYADENFSLILGNMTDSPLLPAPSFYADERSI